MMRAVLCVGLDVISGARLSLLDCSEANPHACWLLVTQVGFIANLRNERNHAIVEKVRVMWERGSARRHFF